MNSQEGEVPTKTWQTNKNHFALVVGINDYSRYRGLKGPIADAEDFIKWLCDEPRGGGLPDGNCRRVLYRVKPNDSEAIQDAIDDEFEALLKLVTSPKPAQRLYVYFSGHGIAPARLATAMCASNWDESWGKDRALNSQQYLEALLQTGKFLEVVMLLDCCRVRLVSAKGRGPAGWPVDPQNSPKCKQFQADAAEFTNRAFEAAVSGANAPESAVRGYFTRALLEALRGAASIPTGGVPAGDLKKYLEKRIPALALVDGYDQNPEIVNGLPTDPEPVFGSAKPGGGPPSGPADGGTGGVPTAPRGPMLSADFVRTPVGISLGSVVARGTKSGSKRSSPRLKLREPEIRELNRSFSATPLTTAYTETTNRYATASKRYSLKSTRAPLAKKASSSLFFFVRAVSPSRQTEQNVAMLEGLELVRLSGKVMSSFRSAEVKFNRTDGWTAFHAAAPPGTYILRFKARNPAQRNRDISISLFEKWQTQAFLMFQDEPLFETLKIFIERPGFRSRSHEMRACDVALNGLQNHQNLLDVRALDDLLHGKFHNPMLGLVGAHVLLQKPDLDPRIAVVLRNLQILLPDSADVAALVRRAELKGAKLDKEKRPIQFLDPPMLRASMDAIVEASAVSPQDIHRESVIPTLLTRMYADSPWTSWETIKERGDSFEPNWVHVALLDELRRRQRSPRDVPPFKIISFAQQIGVAPQTVKAAISELDETEAGKVANALPNELPPDSGLGFNRGWFSKRLRPKVSGKKRKDEYETSGNEYAQV
jgi:hypothetical protein